MKWSMMFTFHNVNILSCMENEPRETLAVVRYLASIYITAATIEIERACIISFFFLAHFAGGLIVMASVVTSGGTNGVPSRSFYWLIELLCDADRVSAAVVTKGERKDSASSAPPSSPRFGVAKRDRAWRSNK